MSSVMSRVSVSGPPRSQSQPRSRSSQGLIGRFALDDDDDSGQPGLPSRPRTTTPNGNRGRGSAVPSRQRDSSGVSSEQRKPSASPPPSSGAASRSPSQPALQSPPSVPSSPAGGQRPLCAVVPFEGREDPEDTGMLISKDTFSTVTSHIMSIQSLLNRQSDQARRARERQLCEVQMLQKENQQMRARLEQVIAACMPATAMLLPAGQGAALSAPPSPQLGGLQGETGGSASGAVEEVDAAPKPPARFRAAVPDDEPPHMKCVGSGSLPPGCLPESPRDVTDTDLQGGALCGVVPSSPAPGNLKPTKDDAKREPTAVEAAATARVQPPEAPTKKIVVMRESVASGCSADSADDEDGDDFRLGANPSMRTNIDPHECMVIPTEISKQGRKSDDYGTSSMTSSAYGEGSDGPAAPKAVFADAAAMKEKIRQAIGKREYNVADYYWETGVAQAIATNQRFEQFTLFIIAFNAVWIAIDADLNDAAVLTNARFEFQFAENFFCAFFTLEWLVRFGSFRNKRDGLKDNWFIFDTFLVVFMVGETWVMNAAFTASGSAGIGDTSSLRLLRLLRLTRMARMARLLRAMPELMILIKGMAVAMRSVFFTLCLLGVIIYLFSIGFRQLTDGTEIGQAYFATVPDSMLSLLLRGTLPDMADIVYEVSAEQPLLGAALLIFILFASLTVMNMLVGVLCEVVSVVSSVEKEQLVVNFVQGQLRALIEHCMGDAEQPMSKAEFTDLLGRPQAARALHEVGVDVLGLMEISDFLFKDEKNLAFHDFMEMVLELRGSNTATVKHIVDLQRFVHLELRKTQNAMERHLIEAIDTVASNNDKDPETKQKQQKRASLLANTTEPVVASKPKSGALLGMAGGGTIAGKSMSKARTKVIKR